MLHFIYKNINPNLFLSWFLFCIHFCLNYEEILILPRRGCEFSVYWKIHFSINPAKAITQSLFCLKSSIISAKGFPTLFHPLQAISVFHFDHELHIPYTDVYLSISPVGKGLLKPNCGGLPLNFLFFHQIP